VSNETLAQVQNRSEGKTDGETRLYIMVVAFPYTRVAVNYQEYDQEITGAVALTGRIKLGLFSLMWPWTYPPIPRSHPDVAKRHYPEMFEMCFPGGAPKLGTAY